MRLIGKRLCVPALALALGACAGLPEQVAKKEEPPTDRTCLRETGTRIEVKEGECAPVKGRVYTNEDIQRTGAQTLNEAISRLPR